MTTRRIAARGSDRAIVGVVGHDPARTGPCGLAILAHPTLKPGRPPMVRQGPVMSQATFKWLGEAVADLCRPGERVLLVCESDAFGPSVARALGMSVGAVEALLLCINAIEPETRVDVSQATWRRAVLPKLPRGRDALKAAAVRECRRRYSMPGLGADEAEALLIATYGMGLLLAPGEGDGTVG